MNNESELYESIENDEWKSVEDFFSMKQELKKAAENMLTNDQIIDIRITSKDVAKLKIKALDEGIPYDMYAASILHKYVNGKLIERHS